MSSIISSFEQAAKDYLSYSQIQDYAASSLARWLPHSRDGNVLELGAGPGVFTRYLVPWKTDICASDASLAMVKLGEQLIPSIKWTLMDALQPKVGPWDIVCSSSMLQWICEPDAMFRNWKSTLTPKGRILCSLFVDGTLREWASISGLKAPLIWKTPLEWEQSLLKSGFRLLRHETDIKIIFYPTALDCVRALHKLGVSPRTQLGAGHLRTLIKKYEKLYKTNLGVPSSWVIYRFEAVLK